MKLKELLIIAIPFVDFELKICIGKKGLELFGTYIKNDLPKWEYNENADGLHYNNYIYVENINDRQVLYHELSHFMEWLYEHMCCTEESEFKAHLLAYVLCKVIK